MPVGISMCKGSGEIHEKMGLGEVPIEDVSGGGFADVEGLEPMLAGLVHEAGDDVGAGFVGAHYFEDCCGTYISSCCCKGRRREGLRPRVSGGQTEWVRCVC